MLYKFPQKEAYEYLFEDLLIELGLFLPARMLENSNSCFFLPFYYDCYEASFSKTHNLLISGTYLVTHTSSES